MPSLLRSRTASERYLKLGFIRRAASRVPFYPFFFGWFSVLFIYGSNPEHVPVGTVALPLFLVTGLTAILVLAGWFAFRNEHRAAVFSLMASILVLSYGHVWSALGGWSIGDVVVGRDMLLVPLWLAFGGSVTVEEARRGIWWEPFAEQLQFTNKKIIQTIEEILRGPDVLWGYIPSSALEDDYRISFIPYGHGYVDWEGAPEETIKLKLPILNAYHVPCGRDLLYPEITPVNTFRLVLSECYGAGVSASSGRSEPYQFERVTELALADGSDRVPSGPTGAEE